MRLDSAVLDIDGTLVDSNYQHAIAWQRAFRSVGVEVAAWRVHRAIGMGGDRLVAHVAGREVEERHGDRVRKAWKHEADAVLDEVRALPGATDLLDALRDRGLKVALATSGKPDHTEHALDLLGARSHIDHLATSADVNSSKPAPDLLTAAREAVGGVRSVMIGDSVWDAIAAREAGMTALGLLTGGSGRDELMDAGAVHVCDDLPDLLRQLDRVLALCNGSLAVPVRADPTGFELRSG